MTDTDARGRHRLWCNISFYGPPRWWHLRTKRHHCNCDLRPRAGEHDMRRPWCQAADPAVQLVQPIKVCGKTESLKSEVRYGVLYNFCPRHQERAGGGRD